MTKKPNYVFDTDDELYHYGIPNQKWGHRRFQNEDGSLTPEGRERYGEGGAKSKSDVQKYKAKVSFKTQQYKADLKSKAQIEKDKRAAKEERNRLKEQAKIDRAAKKEQAKTEKQGRPFGMKLTRTKNMSDEDLQKAVDRLKLQAEYNKQYTLATNPNGALAKADRFFAGPTGQVVKEVMVQTIPKVATAATKSVIDSKLKYSNPEDRKAKELEIKNAEIINKSNEQKLKTNAELSKWEIAKSKYDTAYRREEVKAQQLKNIPDNYEWEWDPVDRKLKQVKKGR